MSKSEWDRASSPGFQALAYLRVHPEQEACVRTRSHFATISSDDTFMHNLGACCRFSSSHTMCMLWNPRSKNFTSDFPQHQPHPAEGLRSGFPSLPLSIRNMETISVCCSHSPTLCFLILFLTFCLRALRAPQGLWCTLCSQCKSRFFFHITEVSLDQINTCTKHKVW